MNNLFSVVKDGVIDLTLSQTVNVSDSFTVCVCVWIPDLITNHTITNILNLHKIIQQKQDQCHRKHGMLSVEILIMWFSLP